MIDVGTTKSSSGMLAIISGSSVPIFVTVLHYMSYAVKYRFLNGYLCLTKSFEGNPLTYKHEILSQKTRGHIRSYRTVKTQSRSIGLGPVPDCDRRTDRILR